MHKGKVFTDQVRQALKAWHFCSRHACTFAPPPFHAACSRLARPRIVKPAYWLRRRIKLFGTLLATPQVVYERISRQQALDLLRQHLTANLVRIWFIKGVDICQ